MNSDQGPASGAREGAPLSEDQRKEAALLSAICKHGDLHECDPRATKAAHTLFRSLGFTGSPAGIRTAGQFCAHRKEELYEALKQGELRPADSTRVTSAIENAANEGEGQRQEEQRASNRPRKAARRGSSSASCSGRSLEARSRSAEDADDDEEDGGRPMPELCKGAPGLFATGHKNVVQANVTAAVEKARRDGLYWDQVSAQKKHKDTGLVGIKVGKKIGQEYTEHGETLMNEMICGIKLSSGWRDGHVRQLWPSLAALDKFNSLDDLDITDQDQRTSIRQLERWFCNTLNRKNELRNQQPCPHSPGEHAIWPNAFRVLRLGRAGHDVVHFVLGTCERVSTWRSPCALSAGDPQEYQQQQQQQQQQSTPPMQGGAAKKASSAGMASFGCASPQCACLIHLCPKSASQASFFNNHTAGHGKQLQLPLRQKQEQEQQQQQQQQQRQPEQQPQQQPPQQQAHARNYGKPGFVHASSASQHHAYQQPCRLLLNTLSL